MTHPQPGPLQIGWSHGSITPDKPVQLHGQFHERVSTHVNDPVTATALAISGHAEGDGDEAIMISADVTNLGTSQLLAIREQVAARLPDFNARKLWVNTTHTHTSPVMIEGVYPQPREGVCTPAEYSQFFVDRLAELAVEAWQSREPATISHALGHAVLGHNRRVQYRDGSAAMYGTSDTERFVGMEGGMDPGVELLFTWDAKGTLTGVMVNIACPSQVVENKTFVSADFWHPARLGIKQRLGEQVQVFAMCSAAGDQSPRDLVRRNRGEPAMRELEGANELGRRLALAVEDGLRHGESARADRVVMRHLTDDLSLPMRKATQADVEAAQQQVAELSKVDAAPGSTQGRLLRRHQNTISRFETQGDDPRYVADLHVLRLGDIVIATNPFELFLDYGLQIKARSRAAQTFVTQLANDRAIYLPTAAAIQHGSYSAGISDNLVGPEGGERLVERTVSLINSLWPD